MSSRDSIDERQIRDAVGRITSDFPDDYWRECDENGAFPHDFYRAMANAGWLGILAPAEYGGGGLGIGEVSAVFEVVASSGAAMNGCTALHPTVFAMSIIGSFGSRDLQQSVLPGMSDGSSHVSFAITEPNSGSNTANTTTVALDDGSDFVVSGRKVWISKATVADAMLILVRTTPKEQCAKPTDGLTLLYADMDPESVEIRKIGKMGRNAVDSCELFIDELRVPKDRLVGEIGKGFRPLLKGLNAERIVIAHEALGIGKRALQRATAYALERQVFDDPIAKYQGIQFPLAKSQMALDAAELMARRAAQLYDAGKDCGREANSAKYLCAEAAFEAADRAVQVHGGFGYAKEYDVERYFRESRVMRVVPVSEEMILNYIAIHVLGFPKSY
jgi:acyl-CoA dehydrogenase